MQIEEIFNERGLATIFRGEVVPQMRKNKTVDHYRARGFRYESPEAKAAGCSLVEASRLTHDSKGVYRARVVVRGVERDQSKSSFFPEHWTREEVIGAIIEAYANREQVGATERLFKGKGRGVAILMYLDERDRVVDAMPKRSNVSSRRVALNLYERTGKRSKKLCATCYKPKILVCPDGHNIIQHRSVFKRLRKLLRRAFGAVG